MARGRRRPVEWIGISWANQAIARDQSISEVVAAASELETFASPTIMALQGCLTFHLDDAATTTNPSQSNKVEYHAGLVVIHQDLAASNIAATVVDHPWLWMCSGVVSAQTYQFPVWDGSNVVFRGVLAPDHRHMFHEVRSKARRKVPHEHHVRLVVTSTTIADEDITELRLTGHMRVLVKE